MTDPFQAEPGEPSLAALLAMNQAFSEHEHGTLVFVLHGRPDVGRTSAAWWADAHAQRFPGGVLRVDLAGYRRWRRGWYICVDIAAVVTDFLLQLNATPGREDSFGKRVEQFRSRTATAPTLVLAYNVEEPAQVRVVVPRAPGSVVIATSSGPLKELALDGAEFIDLDPS